MKSIQRFFSSQQKTVLSAASLVMAMIIASRVLGLIRQRVLASFFAPNELSLFFAAFRLPDTLFEVLVFGTFSSAFIPVFTKALRGSKKDAWEIAGRVVTIGLIAFSVVAIILGLWSHQIYSVIAPGYTNEETIIIANLARVLFLAQGFFVISYVLTGVLESLRRFLVPALAPLFYNLGIIFGTIFLSDRLGLMGPAIGVAMGAFLHFLIQYPLARKLGFRFIWKLKSDNDGVKKIGHLALPRVVDLAFDQIGKTTELFLSSLISSASYTYYIFANTLQLLPVTLFGTSLAKAILPLLSREDENPKEFRRILLLAIFQAIFFTLPLAISLMVLRIPIVRLIYGTKIFDWDATVMTGMVLSVYAIGTVFQTLMSILSRSFFALHDTKTPVKISFLGLGLLIAGDFILVRGFGLPVWALAASFSFSVFVEAIILMIMIHRKIGHIINKHFFVRLTKIIIPAIVSGTVMYFLIKFFDMRFFFDTRYTVNLIALTGMTFLLGMGIYVGLSFLLRVEELKMIVKKIVPNYNFHDDEPKTPTTSDIQE